MVEDQEGSWSYAYVVEGVNCMSTTIVGRHRGVARQAVCKVCWVDLLEFKTWTMQWDRVYSVHEQNKYLSYGCVWWSGVGQDFMT